MLTQELSFPLAFSAGLLSFLSPCVLPLVPIYIGYLTGTSITDQQIPSPQARWFTFMHGLAFVLGFSLVFVAWGAIGGLLGDLVSSPWFVRIGAVLMVVMGLHLLGVVRIPWLYQEWRYEVQRGATPNLFSSIAIGATFGAGWSPCIGPVLGGILTLAAFQGGALPGALLLGVYSLGLGVPFLITALGLGQSTRFIRRLGPDLIYIERASGVLLILVSILMFTGQFAQLNTYFLRFTPSWLLERL